MGEWLWNYRPKKVSHSIIVDEQESVEERVLPAGVKYCRLFKKSRQLKIFPCCTSDVSQDDFSQRRFF